MFTKTTIALAACHRNKLGILEIAMKRCSDGIRFAIRLGFAMLAVALVTVTLVTAEFAATHGKMEFETATTF